MIQAAIFDMDGIVIDSEWMWKEAERKVFSGLGVDVDECRSSITSSMSTKAVAEFWYQHHPWDGLSIECAEHMVVDHVENLILEKGKKIKGVLESLDFLKGKGIQIGLATNSPARLIRVVLEKLDIADYFEAVSSVEEGAYSKPHPEVYLNTARKLRCDPSCCLAFEDSMTGALSARRAGMVVAFVKSTVAELDNIQNPYDLELKNLSQLDDGCLQIVNHHMYEKSLK